MASNIYKKIYQTKRGGTRRRFGIMRLGMEEPSSSSGKQEIDFISAVSELQGLSSLELGKLIKDSDNNVLSIYSKSGPCIEIDVEKLARYLPLHLIAKIILSNRDEESLKYLLCGIRLLHSLCDIAPRHSKLDQILLDDVKISEQFLDLIFYLLAFLTKFKQDKINLSHFLLLHSALVACSLHLLIGCISSQWQDIACVLVAHRKVDVFMDVAFAAVRVDIKFLQLKLSGQSTDFLMSGSNAEGTLYHMCQQCESSLQFLQSLCQQKSFRQRFVKNKELCAKGGALLLVKTVLNLNVSPIYGELSSVVASISRLKSRILAILLHLCEAESVSYLDDVASTLESMDLAKIVASEVLLLIKNMVGDPKRLSSPPDKNYPTGLLHLNALRLADILSDDSNFRSYILIHFAEVLTPILLLPHREFLSSWCSTELSIWEEDVNIEYDSFIMAGCILDSVKSSDPVHMMNRRSSLITVNLQRASYAHQRTSLLVKIIANLHCFVPEIIQEEEDLFLNNFLECLKGVLPKLPDAGKAGIVNTNLCSLLSHAESLTPQFLNEEDVQLLRVFVMRCGSLIADEHEVNQLQESNFEVPVYREKLSPLSYTDHLQEAQSLKGYLTPSLSKVCPGHTNRNGDLREGTSENSAFHEENQLVDKIDDLDRTGDRSWHDKGEEFIREIQSVETSGSDSSSTRGKSGSKQNSDYPNSSEHMKDCVLTGLQEGERSGTGQREEKQRRKRKRTLMNDKQINIMEIAVSKEPDMQRNAASILSWAEHLSTHGSEVTTSQLKNWLNNRKAKLARAAKDFRAASEGENPFMDKLGGTGIGSHHDMSESPVDDIYTSSNARGGGERTPQIGSTGKGEVVLPEYVEFASAGFVQCRPGQHVVLIGGQGEEIGKAKVFQVHGDWCGFNLTESDMCVVDVMELKVEGRNRLPYQCESTCTTFDEAKMKFGFVRILWDSSKLFMLPPQ